jgi:para-nitrobenzyl esterase
MQLQDENKGRQQNMKKQLRTIIIALLAVIPLCAGIQEPIKVEGGLVSGIPGWGWGVREYRSIPFAAPPVGSLRWQPPHPVVPWEGVRSAQRFAPPCMQIIQPPNSASWNRTMLEPSEDCLYLNVWTPASSANEKLPVMIWIYGGGGTAGYSGDPRYDGSVLAKKGVVVVSMNYRVNVFGWLAHPELTAESENHSSGNYGSLDQLAAIRWVKNNIAQFGGDPEKITLFGQSGGSRSVNFLAASPLAKGLMRGVIAQSHTSFGRMTTLKEAEANGVKFAASAGKNTLRGLRELPAEQVFAAFTKNSSGLSGAIVDGWFLPQDIYTIYAQGKQNDIPLLTGATNDEGGSLGEGESAPTAGAEAGGRGAPAAAGAAEGGARGGRGGTPSTLAAYTAWVKQTFGNRADALLKSYPAKNDAEAKKAYHDVYRDVNFAGHRTWAKLQATTGKAPVYMYMFSHIPPNPAGNGNNPAPYAGAVHFTDVPYVFNNLRLWDYPWTDIDRKVADIASTYWSNFAKNLNPNGQGLVNWPVYNPKNELWMNLDDVPRVEKINSAGVDIIAGIQEERRQK